MVTIDSLRRVEVLSGLTDEQLAEVAAMCHTETYNDQEIIVHQGDPSDDIYVIDTGSVEIVLRGAQVTAETLAVSGPQAIVSLGRGQVFGEMALIDKGPRSATVRCTADGSQLYVIGRDDFTRLCEQDTAIGYKVMRNLAADLSFKLRHRNLSWTQTQEVQT
jgi:CRP/FNR family cyclic AMP-dependent transcriptional regulator